MSEQRNTGSRALSNMIWRFAERMGAQLVSLVVSIVIARIVDPEAYGVVAIISAITTILFVFVDSGLGNALIQKKDADDLDFSTVFYTNIVICTFLYVILFLCAPLIAAYYNNSQMTALIRISGLTLVLSSIKNVQQAYVTRNLIFRKFFYATLGGTLGAAVVGIGMAVAGYGVWALVISGLFNNTVDMIVLWLTINWRPKKVFSFDRLKGLFSYGSKLLLASVIQSAYSNIYDLLIGKIYTSSDLAYYNKGKQLPWLVVNNIDDAINSVLLPVMSENQDDIAVIKSMTKRALKTNMYIMTPLLLGLAAIAEPLIRLVYTEKWMSAVPYLQIFALMFVLRPIDTANLSAMKALGRSDLFFKLEIWKDVIGMAVLLYTLQYGPLAIAIGVLISSVIGVVINTWPSKKLFGYGLWEQLTDIFPSMMLSIVMAIAVYTVILLGVNDVLTLLIQIVVGMVFYVLSSVLFKMESYYYVLDMMKHLLHR